VNRGGADKSEYYLVVMPAAIAAADKAVPDELEDSWPIMAAGIVADGEVLAKYEYSDLRVDSIGARRRPSDVEQSASAEVSDFCTELKYQSG
jgi:hypothetical protein